MRPDGLRAAAERPDGTVRHDRPGRGHHAGGLSGNIIKEIYVPGRIVNIVAK